MIERARPQQQFSSLEMMKQKIVRVNDQVRKRHTRSSMNVTEKGEEHSVIWRMFMSVTMESAVFMWNHFSVNLHSIKNTEVLKSKQMFDISEKSVTEQSDEIYGVKTIN